MKPPPPVVCDICMFDVIHDSSPWVEMSCSPGCTVTSSTGMVVPLISACMTANYYRGHGQATR